MPYESGAVVLVPFPFTDQTSSKKRPAVIVSNRTYNDARPDIVVMAITSQMRAHKNPADVVLSSWKSAGLLKPSVIKLVFATLEQALVIRQLGALVFDDRQALKAAIAEVLAL